jgi:hypothetical protein
MRPSAAMLISISRLNLIKSENMKWFEDFERNTCRLLMQVGVGFELVYTKFNSSINKVMYCLSILYRFMLFSAECHVF